MAKQKISIKEQLVLTCIKRLESKKKKLEGLLNDKPAHDFFELRREAKEYLTEYLKEDGTFNEGFWQLDNSHEVHKMLTLFAEREAEIHKRLDAQIKLNSSKLMDDLIDIDHQLSELYSEKYYMDLKKQTNAKT